MIETKDDSLSIEVDIPTDRTGAFIYRGDNGTGDNDWKITLDVECDRDPREYEWRLLGLEMVYIADGPFDLGTTKSLRGRQEVLTPGAGGAPYNSFFEYDSSARSGYGGVYRVTSEDAIQLGNIDGALTWIDANIPGTNTFSGIPEAKLNNEFPKGFQGFYSMKYELSQQQYCDFLNLLTPTQRASRDITGVMEYERPIADYRNSIRVKDGRFITDHPNRPCNFISWSDGLAYADWAGLRHMTEFEFEKACRGPMPAVYREYVWGANEIDNEMNMQYATTFRTEDGRIAASEDGQELVDGNIHASMFSYFNYLDVCVPGSRFYDPDCAGCRGFRGGDCGRGPVRSGIFGMLSDGSRVRSGATYYGAMEMGGNLQEPVVTVGHPSGRRFRGSHGDGELTTGGEANPEDWIPPNGEFAFAGRGGCWKFHENHARIADRFKGLRLNPNRRASHIGFRGVRTQP